MGDPQPKTIEDYKDAVKILKLKILKQQRYIQQLQLKLEETKPQESRTGIDCETPRGKVEIMVSLSKGIKRIGITPQSIFRIADTTNRNCVDTDYFRTVLSKMSLGLTPKQISCLIFIFDQNCTGTVTQQQFIDALFAYKIAVEVPYLNYLHHCLFRLSALLKDKATIDKVYQSMEKKGQIDLNVFSEAVRGTFGSNLLQKEIVGAFHAIDLEAQGFIEKNNFVYCTTSNLNKSQHYQHHEQSISKNQVDNGEKLDKRQMEKSIVEKYINSEKGSLIDKSGVKNNKWQKNMNQTMKQQIRDQHQQEQNVLQILEREHRIILATLYDQIIHCDFKHRITLNNFKKTVFNINPKTPSTLISKLFKEIDKMNNGSIHLSQLMNYALANQCSEDIIFRIFGKYLLIHQLNTEKFFFLYGLNLQSEVNKGKFTEIMKKTFDTQNQALWDSVWNKFGKTTIQLSNVVKVVGKYQQI